MWGYITSICVHSAQQTPLVVLWTFPPQLERARFRLRGRLSVSRPYAGIAHCGPSGVDKMRVG